VDNRLAFTFPAMLFNSIYLDKPFQVRPAQEVLEDIEMARSTIPYTRRVFRHYCGTGWPMAMPWC